MRLGRDGRETATGSVRAQVASPVPDHHAGDHDPGEGGGAQFTLTFKSKRLLTELVSSLR